MRVWGRVAPNILYPDQKVWAEVTTDANGFNDLVYLTNLIQVLKLNLGESPFWGNWGIPAKPSVVQQVFPDYYTFYTQQNFATRFASLIVSKVPNAVDDKGRPQPTYNVAVVTNYGSSFETQVPV